MRRVPPPVINQIALELDAYSSEGGGGGDVTQAEFDALQLQVNGLSNDVTLLENKTDDLQEQIDNISGSDISGLGRQYFTLTFLDITNKFVTLAATPLFPNEVDVYIYTGINQQVGVDFIINGNELNWDGLAMELLVSENSRIFVTYAV